MRLHTVSIDNLAVVAMSTDADAPMQDFVVHDAELLSAHRQMTELHNTMKSIAPDLDKISDQREVDDALETWLGDDLKALQHHGVPLWNGDHSRLTSREATVDEASKWHHSRQKAVDEGEEGAGEES
jgi:hypothetical protein